MLRVHTLQKNCAIVGITHRDRLITVKMLAMKSIFVVGIPDSSQDDAHVQPPLIYENGTKIVLLFSQWL